MRFGPVLASVLVLLLGCEALIGAEFDRDIALFDGGLRDAGVDGSPDDGAATTDAVSPADGGVEIFANAGGIASVQDVYTNGVDVFWTTVDNLGAPTKLTVRARRVDGTNERVVVELATEGEAAGVGLCFSLTGVGDTIWLANSAKDTLGTIVSMNADGTSPLVQAVGEDRPCEVAVFGGKVYWTPAFLPSVRTRGASGAGVTAYSGERLSRIVADPDGIFAAATLVTQRGARRAIVRLDIGADGGGALAPLFDDVAGNMGDLSLGPTHVFFADPSAGMVRSVPKVGGTSINVAETLGYPDSVAVRDATLYVTTSPTQGARYQGTVGFLRLSGGSGLGSFQPLATGRDIPRHLAVDATHVYWIEGTNVVARVPRSR